MKVINDSFVIGKIHTVKELDNISFSRRKDLRERIRFLVIDDGNQEYRYNNEDELLKDWLPLLQEDDSLTGDDTWADIIEYIKNEIL